MKVLLLNQDWFKDELAAAGHEVVTAGADDHFQIRLRASFLRWQELVSLCPWQPEAVIAYDNSVPIFIADLEGISVPTLFYSVDVHHHLKWQRSFRRVFDYVLLAQKDYLSGFEEGSAPISWFPLWASHLSHPEAEKIYEAVFVGTLNPALNPDRVAFFEELKTKVAVSCEKGEYWHIYPRSKVIVNQTVRGDLNFRVFEAMVSGVPLVTEKIENGLFDIFTDGEHLVSYTKGDAGDAAEKITTLLHDPALRDRIGTAGREEIFARHLPTHRAQAILSILSTVQPLSYRSRFGMVANYTALGRFLGEQGRNALPAFTESIRLVEGGIENNEEMNYETGQDILEALSSYDRLSRDPRADRVLKQLTARYPSWFRS